MRATKQSEPGKPHRKHRRRATVTLLGLILFPLSSINSEPLSLDQVATLAVAASHEVQLLQRSLREQRQDLGIKGYLDELSLLLRGSVSGDLDPDTATDAIGSGAATLSGSLEVIPQLIVDASVTASDTTAETPGVEPDRLTASFGITLLPLADTTIRNREELAAQITAADLMTARNAAQYSALVTFLDLASAIQSRALQAQRQELAERRLENVVTLRTRDRATDDQEYAARASVRSGAADLIILELTITRSLEILSRKVSLSPQELQIPGVDAMDLPGIVASAATFLGDASVADLASSDSTVRKAELEIVSAALDVRSARRLSPRVSVTATGGLPDWSYNLAADISVSPADWDRSEKANAVSDLEYATEDLAHKRRLAEYAAQAAVSNLRFAMDEVEYADEQLTASRLELAEAQIRFERGGITRLDRDEAVFAVMEGEYRVAISMVEVAKRLSALQYAAY